MPTFGSLFAGIGGIDLGLERAGWECRWQVESNRYCKSVLRQRWQRPFFRADVRYFPPLGLKPWRVDLIAGGFPCQPFSQAGKRLSMADERWMWPEFGRILRILRPRYVLVENVAELAADRTAFGWILSDLSDIGYDAEWSVVSACALGAPHARRRLFLVAYPQGNDEQGQGPRNALAIDWWSQSRGEGRNGGGRPGWLPEPEVDRVAHGVPRRLVSHPLGALGNAVVPQVAEWIGRRLMEAYNIDSVSEAEGVGAATRKGAGNRGNPGLQGTTTLATPGDSASAQNSEPTQEKTHDS